MFEGILERVLQAQFGKYLEGLDKDHLKLGVWSGDILLENVMIKKDCLDELKLPFKIIFGKIGRLHVSVPWRNLSSQPVEVELETLMLIIQPKPKSEWTIIDFNNFDKKIKLLENLADEIYERIKAEGKEQDVGYLGNLTTKIVDNLQVKIKNIHVRCEENNVSSLQQPFSFGFTLQELTAYTADEDWNRTYIDRTLKENKETPLLKLIDLKNFGMYWQSNENMLAVEDCIDETDIEYFMLGLFPEEADIIDNYNYLIQPITLQARLKQVKQRKYAKEAKNSVSLTIEDISVQLKKDQYDNIIKMVKIVNEYAKYQTLYYQTKKFKFLRPKFGILSSFEDTDSEEESSIQTANINARKWWKYAIQCVIRLRKQQNGWINAFKISSKQQREYETTFIKLFRKHQKDKENGLTKKEELYLEHIVTAVNTEELQKWVKVLTKKKANIEQEESKKVAQGGGIFGYFSSWGGYDEVETAIEEEFNISKDEIEQLHQALIEEFEENESSQIFFANDKILTKIEANFTLKKGGLMLIDQKMNKMQLFSENIKFHFWQYSDESMLAEAYTEDFGIEMLNDNDEQQYSLVKKMHDTEEFWRLKFDKFEPKHDTEFKLDLVVNPIRVMYEASFIKALVQFFHTKELNQQIRDTAMEKWTDLKEGAQSSVQGAFDGKKKDINIHIFSPVMLLPLRKNDPESPLWVVNLGNFELSSDLNVDDQEVYRLKIDSVMIQFFENQARWQLCQDGFEDIDPLDADTFTFLENAEMSSRLGILKGKKTRDRPEIEFDAEVPALKFNNNKTIYNHLVNIHYIFAYKEAEDVLVEKISEKEKLIQEAIKVGKLEKRGDNIKIWQQCYAILGQSYLHIFRDSEDLDKQCSMFLKDAQILEVSLTVGKPNSLRVYNKFGDFNLSFKNKQSMHEWKSLLTRQVIDTEAGGANVDHAALKKLQKHEEDRQENGLVIRVGFTLPQVDFTWYEEEQEWIQLCLSNIGTDVKVFVVGVVFKMGIKGVDIIGHEAEELKRLVSSDPPEGFDDSLVDIEVVHKSNPENPSGDQIDVNLQFGYVEVLFHPPTIQRLIRQCRNIKYTQEDFDSIRKQYYDQIANTGTLLETRANQVSHHAGKVLDDEILDMNEMGDIVNKATEEALHQINRKNVTCNTFKCQYIKVQATLKSVSFKLLHHIYLTPFAEASCDEFQIYYDMFVDHDHLRGTLGQIKIFDLTNYPYTKDPSSIKNFIGVQKNQVLGLKEDTQNSVAFDVLMFNPGCPKKKPGFKLATKVQVSSIKFFYMQDFTLRVIDYFFDQFLFALTNTDPYEDEFHSLSDQSVENKMIKFEPGEEGIKELEKFDLLQVYEQIDLEVKVENPLVVVKARPFYCNEFQMDLGHITVTSEEKKVKGRWIALPQKEVTVTVFKIVAQNGKLFTEKNEEISELKGFEVEFEKMSSSDIIEFIDPLALNQAYFISLYFHPIKAKISQNNFTYLMKCLDLNLNYNDGLTDLYNFKQKQTYIELNPIKEDYQKMKIDLKFPSISLELYFKEEFLTELVALNMEIEIDRRMSFKNIIGISSQAIFLFNQVEEHEIRKQVIMGPMNVYKSSQPDVVLDQNFIETDEDFYQGLIIIKRQPKEPHKVKSKSKRGQVLGPHAHKYMHIEIEMMDGRKDIKIKFQELKAYLRIYVFLLLSHFFVEGLPKYDMNSLDLPNEYDDDPESAPRMEVTVDITESLLCLDDEKSAVACKVDLNVHYIRESILDTKKFLDNEAVDIMSEMETGQIKSQVENSQNIKNIKVTIVNFNPYFCKYRDLASPDFANISKRELIKPFTFYYSFKEVLEKIGDDYIPYNTSDLHIDEISMNISIEQIVNFSMMIQNTVSIMEDKYVKMIEDPDMEEIDSGIRYLDELQDEEEQKEDPKHLNKSPSPQKLLQKPSNDQIDTSQYNLLSANQYNKTYKQISKRYSRLTSRRQSQAQMYSQLQIDKKRRESMQYDIGDDDIDSMRENIDQLKQKDKAPNRKSLAKLNSIDEDEEEIIFGMLDKNEPAQEQKGNWNFYSKGLSIYLVDDFNENFYPVISANLSEFQYKKSFQNENSYQSEAGLSANFYYYNIQAGQWEPFLEDVNMKVQYDVNESNILQIKGQSPINVNVSPEMIEVLYFAVQSSFTALDRIEQEKKIREDKLKQKREYKHSLSIAQSTPVKKADEQPGQMAQKRAGSFQSPMPKMSKGDDESFNSPGDNPSVPNVPVEEEKISFDVQQKPKKKNVQMKEQRTDVATPYTIINHSGKRIYVESKFNESMVKLYQIENNDFDKLVVDYEAQSRQRLKLKDGQIKETVRVTFDGQYLPIEMIDLNEKGLKLHQLNGDDDFEYILYETKIISMNKVLTLRTEHLIRNNTQFDYEITIKSPNRELTQFVLKREKSLAIARDLKDYKIAFREYKRQSHPSSFMRVSKFIFESKPGKTNYVKHGNSYTMVRKEEVDGIAYDINLIPPIIIKNSLPIEMKIMIENLHQKTMILGKGEERHILTFSAQESMYLALQIDGFEWQRIKLNFLVESQEEPIEFQHSKMKTCFLSVYQSISSKRAAAEITFYVRNIFINTTDIPIDFYYNRYTTDLIPRAKQWKNIVLASNDAQACICTGENAISQPFNIEGTGITEKISIEDENNDEVIEFIVKSSISLVDPHEYLYTKIHTVAPFFVVHNTTPYVMLIAQTHAKQIYTVLDPDQRSQFTWVNKDLPKQLVIKVHSRQGKAEDHELMTRSSSQTGEINFLTDSLGESKQKAEQWGWSSGFKVDEVGTLTVKNKKQKDDLDFKYFRIDRRVQEGTIFVKIEQENEKFPQYQIVNKSKYFMMKYCQMGKGIPDRISDEISLGEKKIYAWDDFYLEHVIECQFWYLGQEAYGDLKMINLDNLGVQRCLPFKQEYDAESNLYYSMSTNGYTKILTLGDKEADIQDEMIQKKHDDQPQQIFNLEFQSFGISLIQGKGNERREVLYCSINNIQTMLIDYSRERMVQMQIEQIQIDNQCVYDTQFPVMLMNKTKKEKNDQKFFNFSISIVRDVPDVIYLDSVEFLIQKTMIKIEDNLLNEIVQFVETTMDILDTNFTGINAIFLPDKNEKFANRASQSVQQAVSQKEFNTLKDYHNSRLTTKVQDWRKAMVEESRRNIYIKKFSSSPIYLKISFYSSMKNKDKVALNNFLQHFGLAFVTIDAAPIKLNALELENVFGTSQDIAQILKQQYTDRLWNNVFAILGATNMIGNPIKLANSLGSGVKDFFYKPAQGFVNGPIEGGKGLIDGTGSLLKHTVEGTFGSASNIVSSLSKGLLVLSIDQEYQEKREEAQKEKPKHVIDGLKQGVFGFGSSAISGVTGVATKPIQGAKDDGVLGFVGGMGKGVLGLFVKPVSGTLDLISKTTEGIQNTPNAIVGEGNERDERIRLPRPFYNDERLIKCYDPVHTMCIHTLNNKNQQFKSQTFIDAIITEEEEMQLYVLVIFRKKLLLLSAHNKKIQWQVGFHEISVLEQIKRKGIQVHLKDNPKKNLENEYINIRVMNSVALKKIYELLETNLNQM